MTDFEGLLKVLGDGGVEFILVGGVAATAHGSARLTEDIDVVYSRTPENIARLASALRPCSPYLRGAPPGLPFQWDAETIRRGQATSPCFPIASISRSSGFRVVASVWTD